MTRTGSKITRVNIIFWKNACKNLNKAEIDDLSDPARDLFYFVQSFGSKLKFSSFAILWMVEDTIQSLDTVTCGIFQKNFCDNLFKPDVNSKTQNIKNSWNVTERIICFRPRQKRWNNSTICTRRKHNNYMTQWHDEVPICFRASNVSLSNIVDFGRVKNTKKA